MDIISALLFVIAFLLPVLFFTLVWFKSPKIGVAILAIYVVVYAFLSGYGAYVVNNHGGSDWRRQWCPKYCVYEYLAFSGRIKTSFTVLGALFWPAIATDRLVWHRTKAGDF
jgi:hypothetical protein